jgi:hypothetical protein
MANDNRTGHDGRNQNDKQNPEDDTFPGNPNRQQQNSPGQQQGGEHDKTKERHLHEDRSVTDRTLRRSVLDRSDEDDDGEIDALKG